MLWEKFMNLEDFFVAAFVLALATWSAKVADNSAIVGTWQLKERSQVILDTKVVIRLFGDPPTGYIQHSPGGYLLAFLTAGESKRPASANYTNAERAEIHKRIINGYVESLWATEGASSG